MRVHAIEHVPYEGPALIAEWAVERGHTLTTTLALTEAYPLVEEVGLLVVMGGPMGVGETDRYPWLVAEKDYLRATLEAGTPTLGVCLGAQLIIDVEGGSVYRAERPEIGWYPVLRTEAAWRDPVFGEFPDTLTAGHWHADTFSLPGSAVPMVSTGACPNQAFTLWDGRVAGVQFHLEWTPAALDELIAHCSADLDEVGPYIMSRDEMLERAQECLPTCRRALFGLLDALVHARDGEDTT